MFKREILFKCPKCGHNKMKYIAENIWIEKDVSSNIYYDTDASENYPSDLHSTNCGDCPTETFVCEACEHNFLADYRLPPDKASRHFSIDDLLVQYLKDNNMLSELIQINPKDVEVYIPSLNKECKIARSELLKEWINVFHNNELIAIIKLDSIINGLRYWIGWVLNIQEKEKPSRQGVNK